MPTTVAPYHNADAPQPPPAPPVLAHVRSGTRFVWLIGACIYLIAVWYVGWERFRNALSAAQFLFLIWMTLCLIAALWLRVLKWRVALGRRSGFVRLYFLSKAAGDLSPSRVGELSPLLFRRHRTPQVAAWIVADRLIEIGATLAFGLMGAVLLESRSAGLVSMVALAACLLVILPLLLVTRQGLFLWIARRTAEGRPIHRFARFVAETSGEIMLLRRKLAITAGLTLLATALDILGAVWAYRGFGRPLSFGLLAAAHCTHGIVSAIPFVPNATGVPYIAAAVLLNQVGGVPYEVITATLTVFILISNTVFWASLGIGAWGNLRRKHEE